MSSGTRPETESVFEIGQTLRILTFSEVMHVFQEKGEEKGKKSRHHDRQDNNLRPLGRKFLFRHIGRIDDVETVISLDLGQGLLLNLLGNQILEFILEEGIARLSKLLIQLRLLGCSLIQGLAAEELAQAHNIIIDDLLG